jgi:hypothetical protein
MLGAADERKAEASWLRGLARITGVRSEKWEFSSGSTSEDWIVS